MHSFYKVVLGIACWLLVSTSALAQEHSVARQWNEALLSAIRTDFARPTVHARNLLHTSMAMYDAWAVYDPQASTYFLNHSFRGFYGAFNGIQQPTTPEAIRAAQKEAISYAAFRLLMHRFQVSPGRAGAMQNFDRLMQQLGYDPSFTSIDYSSGTPAALGNYIAQQIIEYGFRDGANEQNSYANRFYEPVNPPLPPQLKGNEWLQDPNRWQPLQLETFVGQSGIPEDGPPPFLSPEWGKVIPFALQQEERTIRKRDGQEYWLYHDPGMPPQLDAAQGQGDSQEYLWNFSLVAIWAAHLDPADSVMIDISPAATGNINSFPENAEEMHRFYKLPEGGDPGTGYTVNPKTGKAYTSQWVPRGDYARVLAEFWADGPDSETPPGHWFTILNAVNDHPQLEKRYQGQGEVLDALEWDVKAYLALGGAVHDAAIAAWGIKGYYDYIRPISAIRAMAGRGQSSDPTLPRYHPAGIPLLKGYIELVQPEDSLGKLFNGAHVNKIKLYTWRGPGFIDNPRNDQAGVGWILAEDWWPYQRPTFVTPPFAGFVSGHSTFSRAAAEVLTLLTGDAYFPGGMSEFEVRKNEFLVFEEGPSVDMTLQWAKYKDAADQCSLSRIWGGIHPPADDMPGRMIGEKVGRAAFARADQYFAGKVAPEPAPEEGVQLALYPNPVGKESILSVKPATFIANGSIAILNTVGQLVYQQTLQNNEEAVLEIPIGNARPGMYILRLQSPELQASEAFLIR